MWCKDRGIRIHLFICLNVYPVDTAQFVGKTFFFLDYLRALCVKKKKKKSVDGIFVGLFLDFVWFHWSMCLAICQHHIILNTIALEATLKSNSINLLTWFLFKVILATLCPWHFHTELILISCNSYALKHCSEHWISKHWTLVPTGNTEMDYCVLPQKNFINWSIRNFALCMFLFKDTVFDIELIKHELVAKSTVIYAWMKLI